MSILVVDKQAVGNRIRLVRKYAAGLSGEALARAMGSSDSALASKMEKGRNLDHDKMKLVAAICAGKGMLRDTSPEDILAFLEGRIDELPVVLHGHSGQMSYFGHVLDRFLLGDRPLRNSHPEAEGPITPELDLPIAA